MTARHVPLGAMFRWVLDAFRMVFRNPGTMFGAGALTIVVMLVTMAPMFLIMGPLMVAAPQDASALMAQGMGRILAAYAAGLVLSAVFMPPLVTGWMRLLHQLDHGRDPGALALLAGFRDPPAWLRALGYALLAGLVFLLLMALFAAAFWGPISAVMAEATANQAAIAAGLPPAPPHFPTSLVGGYLLFLLVVMFFQMAAFVGFCELALRPGRGIVGSLGAALAGVGRNLPLLVVWAICLAIVGLITMVVVGLVLGIVLALLMMAGRVIGMIGVFLVYVPVLLLMYPLMHAGAYLAWKDMLGSADEDPVSAEPLVA